MDSSAVTTLSEGSSYRGADSQSDDVGDGKEVGDDEEDEVFGGGSCSSLSRLKLNDF